MNTIYDPKRPNNDMKKLPLELNFRDPELLIQLNKTNIALTRLDEVANRIPNQKILIEFASIKEGVNSNEIENIRTTIEDAFIAELVENKSLIKKEDKETIRYKEAILYGFEKIKENGLITINDMVELNKILLHNNQGIVSSPSKHIMGPSGIVYTPPQGIELIRDLLGDLEKYYNNFNEKTEIDPVLKLPMLHYQFEAIHPFGDGNGRVGRMLAVLYLVLQKKISLPILFLSEHIIYYKNDYYDHLQALDEGKENALYDFTLWFLLLVETQAYKTMSTILGIEKLMLEMKKTMKSHPKLLKIYSHELITYLFTRPYYSIEGLEKTLDVHRNTASAYFHMLEEEKIVESIKIGRNRYYVNRSFLHELKYGSKK